MKAFFKEISILFEKCIRYATIPDIWKKAIVIPVHKKVQYIFSEEYCYVSSSLYLKENKGEKKDAVRFSRRFNGSQNKGYHYAASLVGRKEGNSYWVEKEL